MQLVPKFTSDLIVTESSQRRVSHRINHVLRNVISRPKKVLYSKASVFKKNFMKYLFFELFDHFEQLI